MGLPGNGTIPAVSGRRIALAKKAGMKVMEMFEKGIKYYGIDADIFALGVLLFNIVL